MILTMAEREQTKALCGATQEEINDALKKHQEWLNNGKTGNGRMDLSRRVATHTNFRGRDLSNAKFTDANLSYSDFTLAKLYNTDFTNCDLTGCIFAKAELRYADFTGAKINDALFSISPSSTDMFIDDKQAKTLLFLAFKSILCKHSRVSEKIKTKIRESGLIKTANGSGMRCKFKNWRGLE